MQKKYILTLAAMGIASAVLLSGCGCQRTETTSQETPEPTVIIEPTAEPVNIEPIAEPTPVPTPIIKIHKIEIEIDGSIQEIQIEEGQTLDIGIPVIEGMRFISWVDADGHEINLSEFKPTDDTTISALMLPEFGTNETYLFPDSENKLEPEAELSGDEFTAAMEQLVPDTSIMDNMHVPEGSEPVTYEDIKEFLSEFYTEEELEDITGTGTITKEEFAALINSLIGRDGSNVSVDGGAHRANDVSPESEYYADLMEASVEHSISEDGNSWEDVYVRPFAAECEPYEEMTYIPATEKGSVSYGKGPLGERFVVYTPYGYDPNTKYNVCVYLNGKDGDPFKILGENEGYGHFNQVMCRTFTNKDYIDFLIQYGYCDPVIVVSTDMTMVLDNIDRYLELVQYTVDNFSTYAESSSVEDLVAAREHFAIAALSTGAQSVCRSARLLPDIFSYYGLFSGIIEYEDTLEALSQKDTIEYLVMCSGGIKDDMMYYTQKGYAGFSALDNVAESNYIMVESMGHCWGVFDAGFRDLLMHFSPNTRDVQ